MENKLYARNRIDDTETKEIEIEIEVSNEKDPAATTTESK